MLRKLHFWPSKRADRGTLRNKGSAERRTPGSSLRSLKILIVLLVTACNTSPSSPPAAWQIIQDRLQRPLYHAQVPTHWQKIDSPTDDLKDTKVPICSFNVSDIKITVHTFPCSTLEKRISPQAQVARWIGQLQNVDEDDIRQTTIGRSGYLGLQLEAPGIFAWSMQLAPEHFLKLSSLYPEDFHYRADYTLKATGPMSDLDQERENILSFARSFELMRELP